MTTMSVGGATVKYVTPVFVPQLGYPDPNVTDYRPVVDPTGTCLLFERTPLTTGGHGPTTLWWVDLTKNDPAVRFLPNGPASQTRPDWLWNTSSPDGPVVYCDDGGVVFLANADGSETWPIQGTDKMYYPTWYPDGARLAVMNETTKSPCTSVIDPRGSISIPSLAGPIYYAGMPSVNQPNPMLVAFAGQWAQSSPQGYNQDLNYILIRDGSGAPPAVYPLEPEVHVSGPFQPRYQARAPWWSPDGTWVAFESDRAPGGYAIFLNRYGSQSPSVQVTETRWQAQHAKWLNPTTLVATVLQDPSSGKAARGIATLDISSIVSGA